jgi:hypothetical protein
MAISRQWAANLLKQLEKFGDQHGIPRSELVSSMGGSL